MDMNVNYAEGWRPAQGDVLVGKVTAVDLGGSAYSGQYPIITVQPDGDGEPVAVHCFHAALLARVRALRPVRGETIGFQYLGKRPHKVDRTREVAMYVVKVKGRDADVWGTLATQPVAAPAPTVHPPVNESDFAPRTQREVPDDDIPF